MSTKKPPLIAIVGPNGAGKTSLAIKLAKKFNGEIISADSRQVYKGMNIGTGKVTKQEMKGIKHHLIDVALPNKEFNVSHFKEKATHAIWQINNNKKIPLLVGGTGFWVQSIIDDISFPSVKPNKQLRVSLSKKTPKQLLVILIKLDPGRAKSIDINNPYRLIRAIEIIKATKKRIPKLQKKSPYQTLIIGICHPQEKLELLIHQRLIIRLKHGMINEVKQLKNNGVSWKRLYDIGLEYRFISLFLQKKLNRQEMETQLEYAIRHYAKRQLTWFKKDKRIHWIKNYQQANKLLTNFLK